MALPLSYFKKNRILELLRAFLINTTLVFSSLAISLLLAEWAIRVWMPCPDYGVGKRPALRNGLFMYDPELGWKGTPNAQSEYISKDFMVYVAHDALGYRNQSPPFVANKKNILLLGDSYGWGWGVENNETAASVFNQQHPNANIYSLSVPGYGTDQEWLTLQRFTAQFPNNRYDDVVLLLYYNDFEDNIATERYSYQKPMFQVIDNKLQPTNTPVPHIMPEEISITEPPPERTWSQKSQLLNFVLDNLGSIIFSSQNTNKQSQAISLTDYDQHGITITEKLLQSIRVFCAERNTRFHVVFLMTVNTDEKPSLLIHQLANRLQQGGIHHSYFYSKRFPRTDLWLDTHYTPYGQKLLAHHISETLDY